MGEGLLETLAAIAAVDPSSLTDDQLAERMRVARRAVNMLDGQLLTDLEVIDRRGMLAAEHGSTQAWLRTEPGVDARTAGRQVRLARALADQLPATAASLRRGDIGTGHVRSLARLCVVADEDSLAAVEADLASLAADLDVKGLDDAVTAVLHSLRPEELVGRERDAFDRRELHLSSTFDGIGVGNWTLDPVGHEVVATAIHAASAPATGDERMPAQRRADGLRTIAEYFLKFGTVTGALPTDHGAAAQVTVVAPLDTILGLPGAPVAITGLGEPISGAAARRLMCDAGISRIITGPDATVLDAGRTMRAFSTAARRAVIARDQHCRWPGCTAPASWCEVHHAVHWIDGGASNVDNGVLLCPSHHDRLHHHRHQIVIAPDGRRTVNIRRGTARDGRWVKDRRVPRPGAPPGGS